MHPARLIRLVGRCRRLRVLPVRLGLLGLRGLLAGLSFFLSMLADIVKS